MISKLPKRFIQSQVHPQKFIRVLKLTDGSIIRVSTLTPPPNLTSQASVSLLNLDSANHPSWNPALRDHLLLDDRGQVAKFRAKFEKAASETDNFSASSDYSDFFEMDPNLNSKEHQLTKTKEKVKPILKKKK